MGKQQSAIFVSDLSQPRLASLHDVSLYGSKHIHSAVLSELALATLSQIYPVDKKSDAAAACLTNLTFNPSEAWSSELQCRVELLTGAVNIIVSEKNTALSGISSHTIKFPLTGPGGDSELRLASLLSISMSVGSRKTHSMSLAGVEQTSSLRNCIIDPMQLTASWDLCQADLATKRFSIPSAIKCLLARESRTSKYAQATTADSMLLTMPDKLHGQSAKIDWKAILARPQEAQQVFYGVDWQVEALDETKQHRNGKLQTSSLMCNSLCIDTKSEL